MWLIIFGRRGYQLEASSVSAIVLTTLETSLSFQTAGGKWQFPFHRWAKEAQRVESTYPGSAEWEFELASHSQAPFCTISGMAEEPSQLLSCGFCSQR